MSGFLRFDLSESARYQQCWQHGPYRTETGCSRCLDDLRRQTTAAIEREKVRAAALADEERVRLEMLTAGEGM